MLVDKIFEIIQTINRQGVTVLLIEQNAFLALEIAQRGYVLETGQVTLSASAAEMLASEHVKKAYLGE
jgi:branched-chain amino acid transport system ATP-binding protein